MKKIILILTIMGISLSRLPSYAAEDTAPKQRDYEVNETECCEPLGYGSSKATSTGISISMMGWGLGLAVAIAILAGVIHQSAAAHSDSSSNNSGS